MTKLQYPQCSAWVIVGPEGVAYIGIHEEEDEVWGDYCGYWRPEQRAELKSQGWYAAKADVAWRRLDGRADWVEK